MRILTVLLGIILPAWSLGVLAADPVGVMPVGANGLALNLDFEAGTLKDWTPTGDAFDRQPVAGDTVSRRRGDMKSNHAGKFWIGTYEVHGDNATGALTSVPFKLTHPYAAFLVGAGPYESTRVELVDAETKQVLFKSSGFDGEKFRESNDATETMRPVIVDLRPHRDKTIFIRVVDQQGGHWGHINFDDFRFYSEKPQLANAVQAPFRPLVVPAAASARKPDANLPPPDAVKFAGLPPEQAAKEMTLPPGFKATLFAGEPDVQQPIAFCIDDRGRLWVVEGMTYPRRRGRPPKDERPLTRPSGTLSPSEGERDGVRGSMDRSQPTPEELQDIFGGTDRILVFEDTDGDGRFNKRTVFLEKLNLVSGIEVGFGGVWIGAAPYLMFVPIQDGDEPKPNGPPQVLLDGWDYTRDTHETLNTFTWGPDGWLYGCHGVFCPSKVGKPGTPDSERQWVDAAVWRFHPSKRVFEVFAEGTSNPWGIDFDERGQCFIEACVVPHFWHMIQGARYQRQGGEHYCINLEETARNERHRDAKSRKPIFPYTYADIQTHGDHVHWAGSKGPHAGNARSDAAGGGHAHAGLLIYQGNSWPAEYRGKIFMNNIHGQRINMDIPERKGSGFVGHHGADLINFNDRWSQVLNLLSDQNGSVFMIDWYDKNQCHHNDPNGHDRSNGRIFQINYGDPKTAKVDLAKLNDEDLVKLLFSRNSWHIRHAQRILRERAVRGQVATDVREKLRNVLGLVTKKQLLIKPTRSAFASDGEEGQIRALWGIHAVGGFKEDDFLQLIRNNREYVRAWAIQLACENRKPADALLAEFARLAREDKSPVVRLYLASALQRLPLEQRGAILEGLITHAEDAADHNLPLMYWYAAEPMAAAGGAKAVGLIAKAKIPLVREFIAKRMAAAAASQATSAP